MKKMATARCLLLLGSVLALLLVPSSEARGPNFYTVLDLNSSHIDESKIRRAFRKKALEVHPDKKSEKKGHKSMKPTPTFELVNEAYELLKGRERSPDTVVHVDIPINKILGRGRYASAHVSRVAKTVCRACQGRGAPIGFPRASRCPTCRGTGQGTVKFGCHSGLPCIQFTGACGTCGGSGYLGRRCTVCGGSGTTSESRSYTAQYPVGSEDGHALHVVGDGDVSDSSQRPGDLILVMKTSAHSLYRRIEGRPLDVKTSLESEVSRLRKGFCVSVERLGGKEMGYVTVAVPPDSAVSPGDRRIVRMNNFTEVGGCLDIEIDVKDQIWVF